MRGAEEAQRARQEGRVARGGAARVGPAAGDPREPGRSLSQRGHWRWCEPMREVTTDSADCSCCHVCACACSVDCSGAKRRRDGQLHLGPRRRAHLLQRGARRAAEQVLDARPRGGRRAHGHAQELIDRRGAVRGSAGHWRLLLQSRYTRYSLSVLAGMWRGADPSCGRSGTRARR